jgi:hypothetical protein
LTHDTRRENPLRRGVSNVRVFSTQHLGRSTPAMRLHAENPKTDLGGGRCVFRMFSALNRRSTSLILSHAKAQNEGHKNRRETTYSSRILAKRKNESSNPQAKPKLDTDLLTPFELGPVKRQLGPYSGQWMINHFSGKVYLMAHSYQSSHWRIKCPLGCSRRG